MAIYYEPILGRVIDTSNSTDMSELLIKGSPETPSFLSDKESSVLKAKQEKESSILSNPVLAEDINFLDMDTARIFGLDDSYEDVRIAGLDAFEVTKPDIGSGFEGMFGEYSSDTNTYKRQQAFLKQRNAAADIFNIDIEDVTPEHIDFLGREGLKKANEFKERLIAASDREQNLVEGPVLPPAMVESIGGDPYGRVLGRILNRYTGESTDQFSGDILDAGSTFPYAKELAKQRDEEQQEKLSGVTEDLARFGIGYTKYFHDLRRDVGYGLANTFDMGEGAKYGIAAVEQAQARLQDTPEALQQFAMGEVIDAADSPVQQSQKAKDILAQREAIMSKARQSKDRLTEDEQGIVSDLEGQLKSLPSYNSLEAFNKQNYREKYSGRKSRNAPKYVPFENLPEDEMNQVIGDYNKRFLKETEQGRKAFKDIQAHNKLYNDLRETYLDNRSQDRFRAEVALRNKFEATDDLGSATWLKQLEIATAAAMDNPEAMIDFFADSGIYTVMGLMNPIAGSAANFTALAQQNREQYLESFVQTNSRNPDLDEFKQLERLATGSAFVGALGEQVSVGVLKSVAKGLKQTASKDTVNELLLNPKTPMGEFFKTIGKGTGAAIGNTIVEMEQERIESAIEQTARTAGTAEDIVENLGTTEAAVAAASGLAGSVPMTGTMAAATALGAPIKASRATSKTEKAVDEGIKQDATNLLNTLSDTYTPQGISEARKEVSNLINRAKDNIKVSPEAVQKTVNDTLYSMAKDITNVTEGDIKQLNELIGDSQLNLNKEQAKFLTGLETKFLGRGLTRKQQEEAAKPTTSINTNTVLTTNGDSAYANQSIGKVRSSVDERKQKLQKAIDNAKEQLSNLTKPDEVELGSATNEKEWKEKQEEQAEKFLNKRRELQTTIKQAETLISRYGIAESRLDKIVGENISKKDISNAVKYLDKLEEGSMLSSIGSTLTKGIFGFKGSTKGILKEEPTSETGVTTAEEYAQKVNKLTSIDLREKAAQSFSSEGVDIKGIDKYFDDKINNPDKADPGIVITDANNLIASVKSEDSINYIVAKTEETINSLIQVAIDKDGLNIDEISSMINELNTNLKSRNAIVNPRIVDSSFTLMNKAVSTLVDKAITADEKVRESIQQVLRNTGNTDMASAIDDYLDISKNTDEVSKDIVEGSYGNRGIKEAFANIVKSVINSDATADEKIQTIRSEYSQMQYLANHLQFKKKLIGEANGDINSLVGKTIDYNKNTQVTIQQDEGGVFIEVPSNTSKGASKTEKTKTYIKDSWLNIGSQLDKDISNLQSALGKILKVGSTFNDTFGIGNIARKNVSEEEVARVKELLDNFKDTTFTVPSLDGFSSNVKGSLRNLIKDRIKFNIVRAMSEFDSIEMSPTIINKLASKFDEQNIRDVLVKNNVPIKDIESFISRTIANTDQALSEITENIVETEAPKSSVKIAQDSAIGIKLERESWTTVDNYPSSFSIPTTVNIGEEGINNILLTADEVTSIDTLSDLLANGNTVTIIKNDKTEYPYSKEIQNNKDLDVAVKDSGVLVQFTPISDMDTESKRVELAEEINNVVNKLKKIKNISKQLKEAITQFDNNPGWEYRSIESLTKIRDALYKFDEAKKIISKLNNVGHSINRNSVVDNNEKFSFLKGFINFFIPSGSNRAKLDAFNDIFNNEEVFNNIFEDIDGEDIRASLYGLGNALNTYLGDLNTVISDKTNVASIYSLDHPFYGNNRKVAETILRDPTILLMEEVNGKLVLPTSVRQAIVTASMHFIINRAKDTVRNSDATIASVAGINSKDIVPEELLSLMRNKGVPSAQVYRDLGNMIWKQLGLKSKVHGKDGINPVIKEKMILNLGKLAVLNLQKQDVLEETFINNNYINAVAGKAPISNDEAYTSFLILKNAQFDKDGNIAGTVVDTYVNMPAKGKKIANDNLDYLMGVDNDNGLTPRYTAIPKKEVPTRLKNSSAKLTPTMAQAVKVLNNIKWAPTNNAKIFLKQLKNNRDLIEKLLGLEKEPPHAKVKATVEGRNLFIITSLDNYIAFTEQFIEDGATDFRAAWEVYQQGRFGLKNHAIDMQQNPIHRALFTPSSFVREWSEEHNIEELANAFKIDFEDQAIETSAKEYLTSIVASKLLSIPGYLESNNEEEFSLNLLKYLSKSPSNRNLHEYNALMNLYKYSVAEPADKVEYYFLNEYDGTNQGYALNLMLYGGLSEKDDETRFNNLLASVGIKTNSNVVVPKHKRSTEQNGDSYGILQNIINSKLSNNPSKFINALNGYISEQYTADEFNIYSTEEGIEVAIIRDNVKYPLMIFNYGAKEDRVKTEITKGLQEKIYIDMGRIEDEVQLNIFKNRMNDLGISTDGLTMDNHKEYEIANWGKFESLISEEFATPIFSSIKEMSPGTFDNFNTTSDALHLIAQTYSSKYNEKMEAIFKEASKLLEKNPEQLATAITESKINEAIASIGFQPFATPVGATEADQGINLVDTSFSPLADSVLTGSEVKVDREIKVIRMDNSGNQIEENKQQNAIRTTTSFRKLSPKNVPGVLPTHQTDGYIGAQVIQQIKDLIFIHDGFIIPPDMKEEMVRTYNKAMKGIYDTHDPMQLTLDLLDNIVDTLNSGTVADSNYKGRFNAARDKLKSAIKNRDATREKYPVSQINNLDKDLLEDNNPLGTKQVEQSAYTDGIDLYMYPEVDAITNRELFHRLDGLGNVQDSAEHKGTLEKILEEIINPAISNFGSVTANIRRRINSPETLGRLQGNIIDLNIANENYSPTSVQDQSAQEAYIEEVLHHITRDGLNNTGLRYLADKLSVSARDQLIKRHNGEGWRAFMPDTIPAHSTQEIEENAAKELWDYMFYSKNSIHEFVVKGVVNKRVAKVLSTIKYSPEAKEAPKNISEHVFNLWRKLVNAISNYTYMLTTGDKRHKLSESSMDEVLYNLSRKLSQVNKKHNTLANKAYKGISYANIHIRHANKVAMNKAIVPLGKWLSSTNIPVVRETGTVLRFIGGIVVNDSAYERLQGKALTNIYNNIDRVKIPVLKELANTLLQLGAYSLGESRPMSRAYALKKEAEYLVDKSKKEIEDRIIREVTASFSTPLTKDESTSVTYGILKTGLAQVFSEYTNNVQQLFDDSFVDNEINDLIKELKQFGENKSNYHTQVQSLAAVMMGYAETAPNTMLNVANIVNGLYEGDTFNMVGDATTAYETLIKLRTMYAIKFMDSNKKNLIKEVINREYAANKDTNGITNVVIRSNSFLMESINTTFKDDPSAMIDGYTREAVSNKYTIEYGTIADKRNMENRGFKLHRKMPKDPLDSFKEDIYEYRATGMEIAPRIRGALSIIDNKERGTTIRDKANILTLSRSNRVSQLNIARMNKAYNNYYAKNKNGYINRNITPSYDTKYATPLIANGKVVDYRYMATDMDKNEKLYRNTEVAQVLGRMYSRHVDEINSKTQNDRVVDFIKEDFATNYENDKKAFVLVSAESNDEKLVETFKLLPSSVRAQLKDHIKQHKGIWVRKSLQDTLLGYREPSITNVFGNKFARVLEQYLTEVTGMAKHNIVIKTFMSVPNYISNMLQLMANDITLTDLSREVPLATKGINAYFRNSNKKNDLLLKLQDPNLTKEQIRKYQGEIRYLDGLIEQDPSYMLIDMGFLSTIVEDIKTDATTTARPGTIRYYYDTAREKVRNTTSPVVADIFDEVMMNESSWMYKFNDYLTQTGDFVARQVLLKHLIKNHEMVKLEMEAKGVPYKSNNLTIDPKVTMYAARLGINPRVLEYIIFKIRTEFVNYSNELGREAGYLDKRMIFSQFIKYSLSMPLVLLRTLSNTPASAVGVYGLASMLNIDTPVDYNYNFVTPVDSMDGFGLFGLDAYTKAAEAASGMITINP